MTTGEWAQFTRALRHQGKKLKRDIAEAPSDATMTAVAAAAFVIEALACATERMSGGSVSD